jgi:hypothetical protein
MTQFEPKDFFELYAMWGVDGITHLSMISGYAKLLLENESGNLTDQQKHYLETILKHSLRAHTDWHHTNNYLALRALSKLPLRKTDVYKDIQSAIKYIREYAQIENVQVNLPNNLPPVKAHERLESAIAYLLDPQPPGNDFLGYLEEYTPTIEAWLKNNKFVNFKSTSGLHINPSLIKQPSDLLRMGTRLGTAKLMIQDCGGDFEIIKMEPNIELQFTLPIWVESEQ